MCGLICCSFRNFTGDDGEEMKTKTKQMKLMTKKQQEFYNFVEQKVMPFFKERGMKFNTINPSVLQDEWYGNDILITIPYGDKMEPWLARAVNECYAYTDKTITVVMGAKINTNAWHKYVFPFAKEIAFVRGGKRPTAIVTYSNGAEYKSFEQNIDNTVSFSIGEIKSNINDYMVCNLLDSEEDEEENCKED